MANSTGRTTKSSKSIQEGRFAKAVQFLSAAEMIETLADEYEDVADAYVTLCIHSGIAASDVICGKRLGVHSHGEAHASAVQLLGRADPLSAKQLRDLLAMKAKAGYSAAPVSRDDFKRAGRSARALLESARG